VLFCDLLLSKMEEKKKIPTVTFYEPSLRRAMKRQISHFKNYCYVSFANGALMFLLLFVFTSIFQIFYIFSLIIASLITMTSSFILNKIYIFNKFSAKELSKQYYHFFIVGFSAFFVNLISLYLLVRIFGLHYLLAQLLIVVVSLPLLFFSHKKFVFKHY